MPGLASEEVALNPGAGVRRSSWCGTQDGSCSPVLFVTLWLCLAGFVAIRDCPWLVSGTGEGAEDGGNGCSFLDHPWFLALSLD